MKSFRKHFCVAAGLVLAAWPVPAQAVADAGVASACGDPFRCVTAECVAHVAAPAVSQGDGVSATVAISASAQAEGAAVPASTQVACVVFQGGDSRGGCTMRLPGGAAACVDTAEIDLEQPFRVCPQGAVLWVPNGETATGPCSA